MDRMWSPWRSVYVNSYTERNSDNNLDGSIFSRIAADTNDAENFVLWRGDRVFVLLNLYPYNNGHMLVVPYAEVRRWIELRREDRIEVMDAVDLAVTALEQTLAPEGMNIGINQGKASGAGVPEHIHVHVLPRWSGDTNFMSTVAETRVIPEAMRETYNRLLPHFQSG